MSFTRRNAKTGRTHVLGPGQGAYSDLYSTAEIRQMKAEREARRMEAAEVKRQNAAMRERDRRRARIAHGVT